MGGFDDLNQNVLGLVALVVSLVALVTTVLQVLQQYFSSAEGYRRCTDSVMGLVRNFSTRLLGQGISSCYIPWFLRNSYVH